MDREFAEFILQRAKTITAKDMVQDDTFVIELADAIGDRFPSRSPIPPNQESEGLGRLRREFYSRML